MVAYMVIYHCYNYLILYIRYALSLTNILIFAVKCFHYASGMMYGSEYEIEQAYH